MTVTGRERLCSPVRPWKGANACLLQVWWLHVAPGLAKGDFGLPRWIMWYNIYIYIFIYLLYIHNVVKHGKTMAKPIVNHPICQGHPKAGSARHGNPTWLAGKSTIHQRWQLRRGHVAMSKGPPRVWGIDPHQQCHGDLLVCVFPSTGEWKVCGWQLCRPETYSKMIVQ